MEQVHHLVQQGYIQDTRTNSSQQEQVSNQMPISSISCIRPTETGLAVVDTILERILK
jgi:hypothetical protein